jgi:hypothetical protein
MPTRAAEAEWKGNLAERTVLWLHVVPYPVRPKRVEG